MSEIAVFLGRGYVAAVVSVYNTGRTKTGILSPHLCTFTACVRCELKVQLYIAAGRAVTGETHILFNRRA